MVNCNEPDGRSAGKSDEAATAPAPAAATTEIEPATASTEAAKTEPVEMSGLGKPAETSHIEPSKPDGAKIDLVPPPPNEAFAPASGCIETGGRKPPNPARPEAKPAKAELTKPAAPKLDWIKPLMAEGPPLPPREPVAAAPTQSAHGLPRSRRVAVLAASLATAAGLGALAATLALPAAAPPIAQPAPPPAPSSIAAEDARALKSTIAQLRADLAALKGNIEAASKSANGQFARMTERFDRIERAQADSAGKIGKAAEALERLDRRADPGVSKEPTGSVPAGSAGAGMSAGASGPAAATMPASGPVPPPVPGWVVRDVYRGVALIQGPRFGLIEVEAGDVVPGLGRIESIRKQDGRWVVTTPRGIIASR